MKHTLFALSLILGGPLFAKTVSYSGSVKLDDGQRFHILATFETESEYLASSQTESHDQEIDYDRSVPEPFVCTRTLNFKGPKFSAQIKNDQGKAVLNVNEVLQYSASIAHSSANGYICPDWSSFDGAKAYLSAFTSSVGNAKIGTYGKSPLWISLASIGSWDAVGKITGKSGAFQVSNLKLTNDDDSKQGQFLHREDPALNRETIFSEFRILKSISL